MGISPTYLGNLAPTWTVQMIPDTGVVNTSGLNTGNFALGIRNLETGGVTAGQGSFSNIVAAVVTNGVVITPATVQYQTVTNDVVLGRYQLWLDVTFSTGVETFYIPEIWEVLKK